MVSWTPYVIVVMYSVLGKPSHISPLMATIPSLFGKSSLLWPSVFYMFSNKKLRRYLVQKIKFSNVGNWYFKYYSGNF